MIEWRIKFLKKLWCWVGGGVKYRSLVLSNRLTTVGGLRKKLTFRALALRQSEPHTPYDTVFAITCFAEILWCSVCVNLQRFCDVTFASVYRHFAIPVCVNLQRFYGTPFASIYRDFTIPCLRQFTEILWCPVCFNLQQCNSQTFYVRRPITVKSL